MSDGKPGDEIASRRFRNSEDPVWPGAIFKKIVEERMFQTKKYGPVDAEGGHDLTGWLIVLQKELNEAMNAATGHGRRAATGRNTIRSELLQIAAVAVAALEQHGLDPVFALTSSGAVAVEPKPCPGAFWQPGPRDAGLDKVGVCSECGVQAGAHTA